MSLFELVNLPVTEKLETLRRLDQFRNWHSLDDKRYCLVCGTIITGREIGVIGGARGTGPVRVICPTRNCHSIPLDWVAPPDEALARLRVQAAYHSNIRTHRVHPLNKPSNSIASRLRRLPGYLRR